MKIKNLETNEVHEWSVEEMLTEINRDRSEYWTAYDKNDVLEGWDEWVEYDGFYTRHIHNVTYEVKERK